MRVNITYSVGIEDIPKEVGELLSKEHDTLQAVTAVLENLKPGNPLETIESLASVREELVSVDMRLAECLAILSGYVDVKGQLALPALSDETSSDTLDAPEDLANE